MPTLPTNPQSIGASGHVNDHNLIVSALSVVGLDFIKQVTFSGALTGSIDSCFSSSYENYRVILSLYCAAATGLTSVDMQMTSGGTASTAATYNSSRSGQFSDNTAGTAGANAQTAFKFIYANGTDAGSSNPSKFALDVYAPNLAAWTHISGSHVGLNSATAQYAGFWGGIHRTATAYDGLKFTVGASTLSGTVRVYGYRNS